MLLLKTTIVVFLVRKHTKTEHHEGKEDREIPIFPEFRPYLEEVWHKAEPGETHFITKYRKPNQNLRSQLTKILRRAGLKPWPKLWQNLRASRQTELAEEFASHVVCQWIGNSQQVARKHYLQVTDEHFAKAVGGARPVFAPTSRPQNNPLDTWLNACPVELDDRRQEIIRQIAQWADQ